MMTDDDIQKAADYQFLHDKYFGTNPFANPSDDKIFTFKEEERQKRIEERERNNGLKIYEKNRPPRDGCRKLLCEALIPESKVQVDKKMQKLINQAETTGFTIPLERQRNSENRWKLVQKK